MKRRISTIGLAALFLLICAAAPAAEKAPASPKTVAEAHPRLALGSLTFAQTATLPENVLLHTDGVQLLKTDIDKVVAAQPAQLQEDLKKNAYLVLDQLATREILLHLARAALPEDKQNSEKKPDAEIIQSYLAEKVLSRATVTDEEVTRFYEAEKSMFGDATLAQMQPSLKQYLLSQKKQEAVTAHIRDLGKTVQIEVSASWLGRQARSARDNPVDKARDSGRPSLVDFGATGCGPCDMMTPILAELKTRYQGKVNVLFIHVREKQILGAKYGIQTIPVQVFFDKDGQEVFRHVGFFPQEEIEKKLAEMGVVG
ncbi:MAG: thioredoxin family protein [Sedimentisphaerales bacterium]|nr:thioredoxin family protein [Sedimentisphaerales bacterium]